MSGVGRAEGPARADGRCVPRPHSSWGEVRSCFARTRVWTAGSGVLIVLLGQVYLSCLSFPFC